MKGSSNAAQGWSIVCAALCSLCLGTQPPLADDATPHRYLQGFLLRFPLKSVTQVLGGPCVAEIFYRRLVSLCEPSFEGAGIAGGCFQGSMEGFVPMHINACQTVTAAEAGYSTHCF